MVLPLLEVERTSLLAISTPSPEGNMVSLRLYREVTLCIFSLTSLQNFYTNMMEAKDPNNPDKPMFKVLQISLACPACMEAGRASECTHSK